MQPASVLGTSLLAAPVRSTNQGQVASAHARSPPLSLPALWHFGMSLGLRLFNMSELGLCELGLPLDTPEHNDNPSKAFTKVLICF